MPSREPKKHGPARPRSEAGPSYARYLRESEDGKVRCSWCGEDPLYVTYHDAEWGMPVRDDARLFEMLCLEGFQSGLSWLTILRKREAFRAAFRGFRFEEVARFGARDVRRLLADPGIVRHRGKIESAIHNARRAVELAEEFESLEAYFRRFEDRRPFEGIVPSTPVSAALGKDLKRRGWTYVGPTTLYAFLQAVGLVNDHVPGCFARRLAEEARRAL